MSHTECLFCKIALKQIPAHIAYDDGEVMAFHDIHPQAPVHLLIIPHQHIATLNDVDDELIMGKLTRVAKHLAKENGFAEAGYRVVMNCNPHGDQQIYHIHLHLLGGHQLHSSLG